MALINTTTEIMEDTGWHHYIIYFNSFLSYITNGVLIYFIIRHSRKDMGTYKILMLLFAIFDIIYPTAHIIVLPNMHVYRRAFVIFPTGLLTHKMEEGHWGIVFYVSLFCLSHVLLSFHFVYRYLLICKNHLMYLFNSIEYVPLLFCIWLSTGIMWGSSVHITMYHTETLKEYVRSALWNEYSVNVDKVPVLGPLYFLDTADGGIRPYWRGCIGSSVCIFILIFSFTIIVFCTIEIISTLRTSLMSKKAKKLQYDMLKALMMQTLVPVICEYIPCAVTFSSPFLGIPLGKYCNFVPIALSLYPILDSLCLLYFVKDYRHAIMKLFNNRVTVSTAYTTTTMEESRTTRNNENRMSTVTLPEQQIDTNNKYFW